MTVARFYTPTGRAIQRPYGENVDYGDDYFARYERGELFHQDSIATVDSLTYITPAGRWCMEQAASRRMCLSHWTPFDGPDTFRI